MTMFEAMANVLNSSISTETSRQTNIF